MNSKAGLLINKINFISGRIFNKLIKNYKELDINHAQGKILFIISRYGVMSMNDLCKELSLSKSTLTSMIERLYSNGYINKEISHEDKRITLISNTEKALNAVKVFEEIIGNMESKYYEEFSEDDIKRFEYYLDKVYSNLEKIK